MSGPLVVIGDALLDRDLEGTVERLSPDAPVPIVADPTGRARPGGAALAATLAASAGQEVVLVAALAADDAAEELRAALADGGVALVALEMPGGTPEKVRICAGGRPLLRLDHATQPVPPGPLTEPALAALRAAGAVLVSDYGRGITARADVREEVAALCTRRPVVWDPHPR